MKSRKIIVSNLFWIETIIIEVVSVGLTRYISSYPMSQIFWEFFMICRFCQRNVADAWIQKVQFWRQWILRNSQCWYNMVSPNHIYAISSIAGFVMQKSENEMLFGRIESFSRILLFQMLYQIIWKEVGTMVTSCIRYVTSYLMVVSIG